MDNQMTEDRSPGEQTNNIQAAVRASADKDRQSLRTISLSRSHQARLSIPRSDATTTDILSALEFPQPEVLILMVGDNIKLTPALETRLVQLFSRGVARTLAGMNAAIIDNGRQVGISKMMGHVLFSP